MAIIKRETTKFYDAELVGTEDYNIVENVKETRISYDEEGKRTLEVMHIHPYDWEIVYKDGLEDCTMFEGVLTGKYSHEKTSDKSRSVQYDGEKSNFTKDYEDGLLVYLELEEYGDEGLNYTFCEFEYDDKRRLISKKKANIYNVDEFEDESSDEAASNDCEANGCNDILFRIEELIYEGDELRKQIYHMCDSPSLEDFYDGNYTIIAESDVEVELTKSEEQVGDERIVTIKSHNTTSGAIDSKTISTYDAASNCIKRKLLVNYFDDNIVEVEETEYEYW